MKNRYANALVVSACCALTVGCGQRDEENVVVQPPQTVVKNTEETQIKPVPQDKTVVVQQPSQQPQAEVKTETKVKVDVDASDGSASSQKAAPASAATPRPKPTATPKPKPTATPRPKPTATPRPKPKSTPSQSTGRNAPITLRAEIVSTSNVPDPKTVAYKDSIVFHKYRVLSVQNGSYSEKEILAAHWGMRNKKLQPAARYRVGQVQTLRVEPMERHPELESLQRNDDTGEYDLDPYWVVSVS